MATDTSTPNVSREDRIRSTALSHARDIEDRKRLQAQVADLVVEAFDLPSKGDADPANPQAADAARFKQCLALFQASDLDDLVYERNVDSRCGYALCPRPNQKLSHAGQKVWNQKGGKNFKLLDRSELERWCSTACQERTVFVRAQLGDGPAWLREVQAVDVKLMDEVGHGNLADSFQALALSKNKDDELMEKMQDLALERGELNVNGTTESIELLEKTTNTVPTAPSLRKQKAGSVEGHEPRRVKFSDS